MRLVGSATRGLRDLPLYEYQCSTCGDKFEVIQKFSDDPLKNCRKCDGQVERLISSPAIQFKGTGWYVTDYAKKGSSAEKTESDTPEPSSKKPDKKPTDSKKPADKPPAKPKKT